MSAVVEDLTARSDRPSPLRAASGLTPHAPALCVVACALVVTVFDGGFPPTAWYSAGIFLLLLGGLTAALSRLERGGGSRAFFVALAALALFTGWSYISIAWAATPADAWDGANRTLVYLLVLAVVGWRSWSAQAAQLALAVVAGGVAAIGLGLLVVSAVGPSPETLFLEGRLSEPVQYANGTAALWLIGWWPAVHLSTVRSVPWPLRALALAAACLLLQLSVLSQSRGAALALLVTAVVYVALTPQRGATLAALALLVGLTAATWDVLVAVRLAETVPELAARLADARTAIALSCLASLVVGAVAAAGARRLPGPAGRRRLRRGADVALVVVALSAIGFVATFLAANPGWPAARWDDFKSTGYESVEGGQDRFGGSLGSGRYDFYRVALEQFGDHPLGGIGADNFAVEYLASRRTPEAPMYPHSLGFRVLSQLGVVGAALFVVFLVAVAAAFARSWLRAGAAARGAAVAAGAAGSYWLLHGLVDWLWEIPGPAMLAVALLGVAARTSTSGRAPVEVREDRVALRSGRALKAGLLVVLLVAAASLLLPFASHRYAEAGSAIAAGNPGDAYASFGRAAELNPLTADPLVAQAIVARRLSRPDLAELALRSALRREPSSWFAHFELALLRAEGDERRRALRSLARAQALNPRQPLLEVTRRRLERGERVEAAAIERELYGQLETRLRATRSG